MPEPTLRGSAKVFLSLLVACGPLGPTVPFDAPGATNLPEERGSDGPSGPGVPSGGTTDPSDAGERPDGGSTPPPKGSGGYYVDGPAIYTKDGVQHRFLGIDRPSLEWTPGGEQLSADDYVRMASWKANVVRIALNQGFWLEGSKVYEPAYRSIVDQNVAWAEAAGLDVILDLHWSDRGDFSRTPAQELMADEHSVTFWTQVAERYKGDGRVLFELYNEPHDVSWDIWRAGGVTKDGYKAVGMQQLYDAVRKAGANNLVVIGGLDYAFDLSGVPRNRIKGFNIVYATHPYRLPNKNPESWDRAFGVLTQTDPVMATEFGDFKSCSGDYSAQLISYAEKHGMSWSAWAWYPGGCEFPSLLRDWSGAPTAAGQVVKDALARR